MQYAYTVTPGIQVRLRDIDPDASGGLTKDEGREQFASFNATLDAMQEELYAAGIHALLLILQGMDTAGKDGAIRNVCTTSTPRDVGSSHSRFLLKKNSPTTSCGACIKLCRAKGWSASSIVRTTKMFWSCVSIRSFPNTSGVRATIRLNAFRTPAD
jgi:Polyphosphate:AMP phosphotransferase (EC 2.7.4.-)